MHHVGDIFYGKKLQVYILIQNEKIDTLVYNIKGQIHSFSNILYNCKYFSNIEHIVSRNKEVFREYNVTIRGYRQVPTQRDR